MTTTEDLSREIILDHYQNPRNHGRLDDPTVANRGQFYAIDDLCTHDGGSLDQGQLEGDEIECPRHGARFNVTTGAAIQLPAFEPVETHDVRVDGDALQVGVEHR